MRRIDTLVIHHSATPRGDVESIRAAHRKRGYADIGYHDVIGNGLDLPDGHISTGRPHDQVGAGVFGANTGKLHVCLIGNFEEKPPTPAQLAALGHWLHTNLRRYKVAPAAVVGHREIALEGHGTLCPGRFMPLDRIRAWCAAESSRKTPARDLATTLRAGA